MHMLFSSCKYKVKLLSTHTKLEAFAAHLEALSLFFRYCGNFAYISLIDCSGLLAPNRNDFIWISFKFLIERLPWCEAVVKSSLDDCPLSEVCKLLGKLSAAATLLRVQSERVLSYRQSHLWDAHEAISRDSPESRR